MKHFYLFIFLSLAIFKLSCQSTTSDEAIKLSSKVFNDSIEKAGVQIIDVRTPKEFHTGHIMNAININFYSEKFTDSISLLNTKKPVFIYCRSGKRSSQSISIFKEVGFDDIYELEGGILNWKKEGF